MDVCECTSVNRSKVKLYCLILITHVWQFDVLHTKYCIDTYVGTHTQQARSVVNQWGGGFFSLSSGPIHIPGLFGGQPVGGSFPSQADLYMYQARSVVNQWGVLFPLKRTYTCTRPVRWSTSGGGVLFPLKRTYTCTRPVRWSTSGGGGSFPSQADLYMYQARSVVNQWGGVLFPLKRTYTCTRPVRWSTSGGGFFSLSSGPIHVPGPFGGQPVGGGSFPSQADLYMYQARSVVNQWGGVLFPLKRTYTCTHTCTQHGHTHVCMQTPTHPHMHTHTRRK